MEHRVNRPITHNGVAYNQGHKIELSEAEAAQFQHGQIGPLEGEEQFPQAVQPEAGDKTTYRVLRTVTHDDQHYQPGDLIELTESEAAKFQHAQLADLDKDDTRETAEAIAQAGNVKMCPGPVILRFDDTKREVYVCKTCGQTLSSASPDPIKAAHHGASIIDRRKETAPKPQPEQELPPPAPPTPDPELPPTGDDKDTKPSTEPQSEQPAAPDPVPSPDPAPQAAASGDAVEPKKQRGNGNKGK